jgi:hypothetical protein
MLRSIVNGAASVFTRLCWTVALFAGVAASAPVTLYSPDRNQIWNRVHAVLRVRIGPDGTEYGADDLDPLLWISTKHLLTGKAHAQAVAVLNEFVARRAERLITHPVQRAMFQHDLWRLFDWADTKRGEMDSSGPARELQLALARVMQSVALTDEQIEALPDNLQHAIAAGALPDFLADLFDADGPWVCVRPRGADPAGATHASFFSESTFLVFIRLPGVRADTLAYLANLNDFHEPIVVAHSASNSFLQESSGVPQFPAGTRTVLLRQMMVVDRNGRLVPTHVTLSLQTRLYRTVPAGGRDLGEREEAEYDLSREKLFAGKNGGLTAVTKGEARFSVFMSHGDDPFENGRGGAQRFTPSPVLQTCHVCHEGSGIYSVCTYMCNAHMPPIYFLLDDAVGLYEGAPKELVQEGVRAKQSRHDFGLLEGLWKAPG